MIPFFIGLFIGAIVGYAFAALLFIIAKDYPEDNT